MDSLYFVQEQIKKYKIDLLLHIISLIYITLVWYYYFKSDYQCKSNKSTNHNKSKKYANCSNNFK